MRFSWDGDAERLANCLWNALDAQNRIALYVEVQTEKGMHTIQKSRFCEEA